MGTYLKKFENHTWYDNYINSSDAILPNISLIMETNGIAYNPYVELETSIVTKYYVERDLIMLFNYQSGSGSGSGSGGEVPFSSMEIDGVEQSEIVNKYTFDTSGEHTVKYTLTNPTIIDNKTFYECLLTSVIIPDSVTNIGDSAFANCNFLTSVTVKATTPPTLGNDVFTNNASDRKIYVPSESVEAYKSASGWSVYADSIQAIS